MQNRWLDQSWSADCETAESASINFESLTARLSSWRASMNDTKTNDEWETYSLTLRSSFHNICHNTAKKIEFCRIHFFYSFFVFLLTWQTCGDLKGRMRKTWATVDKKAPKNFFYLNVPQNQHNYQFYCIINQHFFFEESKCNCCYRCACTWPFHSLVQFISLS